MGKLLGNLFSLPLTHHPVLMNLSDTMDRIHRSEEPYPNLYESNLSLPSVYRKQRQELVGTQSLRTICGTVIIMIDEIRSLMMDYLLPLRTYEILVLTESILQLKQTFIICILTLLIHIVLILLLQTLLVSMFMLVPSSQIGIYKIVYLIFMINKLLLTLNLDLKF